MRRAYFLEMSFPQEISLSYEGRMGKERRGVLNRFYRGRNFSPWRSALSFKAKGIVSAFFWALVRS